MLQNSSYLQERKEREERRESEKNQGNEEIERERKKERKKGKKKERKKERKRRHVKKRGPSFCFYCFWGLIDCQEAAKKNQVIGENTKKVKKEEK